MRKDSRIIPVLSLICAVSVFLMAGSLFLYNKRETGFVPPCFDEEARIGIPSPNEIENCGWARISRDGMPYSAAVSGEIGVSGGKAVIYLTNYEENNVWLKLRILNEDGKIIAETGLVKPGEYIEAAALSVIPKAGEKIRLKIMAYEPETYYSAGAVVLNTEVKTVK